MSYNDYLTTQGFSKTDIVADLAKNLDPTYLGNVTDYYATISSMDTDKDYVAIPITDLRIFRVVNGTKSTLSDVGFAIDLSPTVTYGASTEESCETINYYLHGDYILLPVSTDEIILHLQVYNKDIDDEIEESILNLLTSLIIEDVSNSFNGIQLLSTLTTNYVPKNTKTFNRVRTKPTGTITPWQL